MEPLRGISAITGRPIPTTEERFEQHKNALDKIFSFVNRAGMEAAEFVPGSGEYLSATRALSMGQEAEQDLLQGNFTEGFKKYLEAFPDVVGSIPGVAPAMFLGMKAKTASKSLLKKAMDMRIEGASPQKILKETGWFKGADNRMRFEISDRPLRWKMPENLLFTVHNGQDQMLRHAVKHPILFKSYPELKNTVLNVKYTGKEGSGVFMNSVTPPRIEIKARNAKEAREILAHELQHNIQWIEGFARGGNWKEFPPGKVPADIKRAIVNISEQLNEQIYLKEKDLIRIGGFDPKDAFEMAQKEVFRDNQGLLSSLEALIERAEHIRTDKPYKQYRKLSGEIEARDTTKRLDLKEHERRDAFPRIKKDAIFKFEQPPGHSMSSDNFKKIIGSTNKVLNRSDLESLRAAGWTWKQAGLYQSPGASHSNKMWRMIEPSPGNKRPVILIPPEK
jgi:hypothetical protein